MSTSPVSSFSGRAPAKTRSSRPSIPSPLSSPSYTASSLTTPSPPWPSAAIGQRRPPPIDTRPRGNTTPSSAGHTTFYSDSSSPSSPDEESPRPSPNALPNDTQNAQRPLNSKPTEGSSSKAPSSAMASAATSTAAGGAAGSLPRNSSIDSAISAASSSAQANNAAQAQANSEEIAKLIKTAGSPEAVIQYLLKEKQSQAQQNSQLWRLVDKQRAMILGLNKDLEAALKDKEKYRKKLKELMANPLLVKPPGWQGERKDSDAQSDTLLLRQEVESPKEPPAPLPNTPKLDTESLGSPVDMALAPYPITPPADRSHAPPSAVSELLNPSETMPEPQEYALDHYNHEAEEQAEDKARREKNNEQLNDIPFDTSLPPSRSLPSHPPQKPPPKPPAADAPPTVTVMGPTPQPDEGISKFPSPPRKAPPAPLQLRQEIQRHTDSSVAVDDADSDYDDVSEVDEIIPEKRGRRRTREEDDREREVIAIQEAEARSVSKQPETANSRPPLSPSSVPASLQPGMPTASLDAVLSGDKPRELTAPVLSPGLPASPRPFGNPKMTLGNPPLSPRGGPLSPRPPRQAIPMPPGTPLVVPPTASLSDGNPLKRAMETGDYSKGASSPVERTVIYRGLVTDEYPDLLLPPNALPSIAIRVASSRMKPSRASLLSLTQLEEDPVFTLAIISRADGGELWRVEKDSASLAKLDQRLKQCPAFTARTPDRSLFTGHAPAKIDARRAFLDQYMDELLNTPLDTPTALELCKYLSNHTLPPNADETGQTFKSKDDNSSIRSDGRPTRNGYLTKKGKNFGGWKSRFFVLNGPLLKYYETPGGAHLGTIKLQNAQIGKQSHNNEANTPTSNGNDEELDSQYRHAFLILEPKKKDSSNHVKHVLCAENDRERDIWVDNLLQWIDYREPDEDQHASRPTVHDRQTSGDQLNKSKKGSKAGQQQHQTAGSDTLIGVRYDSTHAGDAPHQGNHGNRPKTAGSQNEQHHHASTDSHSKLISAPKDPQVISDASSWGSRMNLAAPPPAPAPSHDEKKQRKRSFFGFGPKSRTSSDGQESMFGGSESGSGATPPQNGYHGPVRQVFGAPLAEAVRYNPPLDVDVPLPSVVYRCIQYLEAQNAILEEGIFRLSGSNVVIKQLRERFNTEGDINLVTDEHYYDIHAVASLLKLYLRELPTSILTRDLHLEFMSTTTEITDKSEKMVALGELCQRLPQANATLLKYLIAFLIRIINNSDVNKMTVRNVGIVFSPTLNIPAPVFATFLQNYEAIFGVDPEEYELPSPVSETGSHGRSESTPRFDPPPGRPSTSSGSASPRHQPWSDMRDPTRSTPTPPLLMNLGPGRGSPTPPAASRHSYEPSYLTHQSPRAVSNPLQGTSGGADGHFSQPPHRASPAYERSLLPVTAEDQTGNTNLAAYDQGSRNRRRESTIMMGGSGSKSRLREETHF